MNRVMMSGRLTADPEVRYSQNQEGNLCIARYNLAVAGPNNKTDFFRCVAYNGAGQFAEKYLKKGVKVIIEGSLHNREFDGRDGKKVRYEEITVNSHEFCEKKESQPQAPAQSQNGKKSYSNARMDGMDGFMNVPDEYDGIPFN